MGAVLKDQPTPGPIPPPGPGVSASLSPAKVPDRPANLGQLREVLAWADLTYWPQGADPFVLNGLQLAAWPYANRLLPAYGPPPRVLERFGGAAEPPDPFAPVLPWIGYLAAAHAAADVTQADPQMVRDYLADEVQYVMDEADRREHLSVRGLSRWVSQDGSWREQQAPPPASWEGLAPGDSPALWRWALADRRAAAEQLASAAKPWSWERDATAEAALLTGQRIYDAMARTWPVIPDGPTTNKVTAAPLPSYR